MPDHIEIAINYIKKYKAVVRTELISLNRKRIYLATGILFLLGTVIYLAACAPSPRKRTFARKNCLDCHTKFADTYLGMKDVHTPVKEKKCESCHLRHGIVPKLLFKNPGNQMCYTCHQPDKIGLDKPMVHTALTKGRCTDCHNPHASPTAHLLKAEGSELCYQCHKKENFQKKVVHKILQQKSCDTCHLSHSSDEANLLKANDPALCLACHASNQAAFRKGHGGYPVETSPCDSCHNPHSSLQPKLLKTSIHPVVAEINCEKCHNPPGSQQPFQTRKKGSNLCYDCHKAVDLKGGGDIEHAPFQKGECASCHNPHTSENQNLLAKKGRELCFGCHSDRNVEVSVPHKAVTTEKECLSCHVSHAGRNQKLLFAKEEVVCYSCHVKTKADLETRKPHKPFVEGKCSGCHNPHGSNFVAMFQNRMDVICYSCHVDAEVEFTKTNTHKPVIDGNCDGCHRSHGTNEGNLLMVPADDPVMCAKCHGDLMTEAVEGGSNHQVFKNGKCLKCHEVHGSNYPGMLVAKQGFLCYSCHSTDPGKEIKDIKSRHAPVVSGECTACHSPHKANLASLLLAKYPDLCLSCHTDLKDKMYKNEGVPPIPASVSGEESDKTPQSKTAEIYVHALSDLEKCQTCHKPHFSAESALLVEPIQPLCSKCHDYREPSFGKAHLEIAAGEMDCRNCHAPHTSKDPKFFKADVHKPFADRACIDCHLVEKP